MTVASSAWRGARVTRWWHIRHGPVPNPQGLIVGQQDWPADLGDRAAVAALAARLPADAVWVASPLGRARATAAAILAHGDASPPLEIEPALCEQSFGDWQGQPFPAINDGPGDRHPFWVCPAACRPPRGESFDDLMARVAPALERLTAAHSGRDIVAVSHGGTIRAAVGVAIGLPAEAALRFAVENLSLSRLDHVVFADGTSAWQIVRINSTAKAQPQDTVARARAFP